MNKEQYTTYFRYLDELRLSGQINMYVSPYRLKVRFDIPLDRGKAIFQKWMDTFNDDDPPQVRAAKAAGEI